MNVQTLNLLLRELDQSHYELIRWKESQLHCTTMSDTDRAKLSDMLTLFTVNLIDKFVAGQKEHGGSLSDRDLKKEVKNEVMDLVVYTHWD